MEDLTPPMILQMIQSFILYWTNPLIQSNLSPETRNKISTQFAHLSERERQMLARFSEDMPQMLAHFCKYVSIQDILDKPEVKDDRIYFSLRFQPMMESLETDYPDFASELSKTKDKLQIVMTLLTSPDCRPIGKLVWKNAEMFVHFSLPLHFTSCSTVLEEILPRRQILQIDISFAYLGTS